MSLTGFRASNHPQQVAANGVDDDVDDRATHPMDFGPLNDRFGFTIDVAAAPHNAKCERFYTREQDGLTQDWGGEVVWCNPPFSDLAPWVRKAWAAHVDATIVMLMPANRTEQQFWQLMVEPYRDRPGSPLTTTFLPGRMRFLKPGQTAIGPNQRPPFGCVLLVWQRRVWTPNTVPADGLFSAHTIEGATSKAYEEHECREAFLWDGAQVFGPHIDVTALRDIARMTDARPTAPLRPSGTLMHVGPDGLEPFHQIPPGDKRTRQVNPGA